MIIGSGRGDMVGCFLREDLGEVGIFQWEGDLGFRLFSGDGKLSCRCKFDDKWGVREEAFAITSKDPVDLAIVQGVLEVLVLHVMI